MVRPLTSARAPPAAWRRRFISASNSGSTITAWGVDASSSNVPSTSRNRHQWFAGSGTARTAAASFAASCIIRGSIRSAAGRGLTIFVS